MVPSRRIHSMVTRMLLGKDYEWLHCLIDFPSRWLGKRHRILMHSDVDPLITLVMTGDPDAALAHYLHIKLDRMCSRDKKLEKILELYRLYKMLS